MKSLLAFCLACGLICCALASTITAPQAYVFEHPEAKETWKSALPKDCVAVSPTCVYSAKEKTVYLLAEITGIGINYEVEFILLGQLSDRAYEALAVAWDNPSTVGKAIEALGVPKGKPANIQRGMPMAQGERFTLAIKSLTDGAAFLPLSDYISDNCSTPTQNLFGRGFPYIGGTDFDDLMPASIVSSYSEPVSLFGMPYAAEKSAVYGLFRSKKELVRGEPVIVSLKWEQLPDAQPRVYHHQLKVTAETLQNADKQIELVKALASDPRDIFLEIAFDPSLKLAQIKPFAGLLLTVEEHGGFVIAPPKPGQIPLRAFLPNQAWRDRESRVFQPWEVEIHGGQPNGAPPQVTLCQILEDWTVEGINPALTRKCYPSVAASTIVETMKRVDVNDGKIYVVFFYVTPETTVADLAPFTDALTEPCPTQWIFFTEETPPEETKPQVPVSTDAPQAYGVS